MSATLTIRDALQGVNAYPVPEAALLSTAARRGLSLDAAATDDVLSGRDYRLATADVLAWLAGAPDVSQGGQSYSFTDAMRAAFRSRAAAIYAAEGEDDTASGTTYGYKGSLL